jgi:ubiquinone biosynthesis protein Coq4
MIPLDDVPFADELAILSCEARPVTDRVFAVVERLRRRPELTRQTLAVAERDPSFVGLWRRGYVPTPVPIAELAGLPEGTLGRAYARHLTANGLAPDFYPDVEPRDLAGYFSRRMRQTHDIWHALLGLGVSPAEELALQAFGLAQVGSITAVLLIAHGLLSVATATPEHAGALMAAVSRGFAAGERADFLLGIPWEEHWSTPIDELRAKHHLSGFAL